MATLVARPAPDFTADAVFPDDSIKKFTLSALRGRYVILFFYPLDFTFVCPSEILAFNKALPEFAKRGADVVGASVDSAYSHFAWRNTPTAQGGIGRIAFPLVSDLDKSISRAYGVLLNESIALRGLFLMDRDGVVQHELVNNASLGRNVCETLRILDALQFTEKHGEVCPANWKAGEEAMKPTADGVASYLRKHG